MRSLCVLLVLLSPGAFAKGILATMSMSVGEILPNGDFQATQAARPTDVGVFCAPSPLYAWTGAENRLEFRTNNEVGFYSRETLANSKKKTLALDIDYLSQSSCYVQVEYIMQHYPDLEVRVVMTKERNIKEVQYCKRSNGKCSVAPASLP